MTDVVTNLETDVEAIVMKYAIGAIFEALVELSDGATLASVVQMAERRALRLAADAEAEVVLRGGDIPPTLK